MIFEKEFECAPLKKLKEIQLERLKKLLAYLNKNVSFYHKKFTDMKIKPDSLKSVKDIKHFPFTKKTDLRDHYPFGLFAVPLSKVYEIHASSGTTGNPTVVGYTKKDIKLWSRVMARALACAGVDRSDIVHNAYGYGLFTGGLGFHYGAMELGVTVLPMSSGGTKRQLKLMQDFKTTIITCTPSYTLYMAEEAKEMGIDPLKGNWRIGVLGAEPWTDGMRKEIESVWNMTALDIYGLSEIIGPGVAQECEAKDGLHLFADEFYPEVIDPDTGEPMEEGVAGELTLTTLTKEAIPLLRYRTGDIVSINHEPCKVCGRTLPRISKIKGRTDDMLIIRGINVFPSQIESVLLQIEETEPHYLIVVDRVASLDQLEIQVEVNEKIFSDEIKKLEELEKKIKKEIESVLGLQVSVRLVEPKTIERSQGKSKRVIDKRKF